MAKRDLDVVRRMIDAFNRGDTEAWIACLDPEVIWEEGGVVFPDLPAAYYGPDGVRRWHEEAVVDAWESLKVEPLDLHDDGEGRVSQLYRLRGRGKRSGVEVDMRVRQTHTLRDGLVVYRRIEAA